MEGLPPSSLINSSSFLDSLSSSLLIASLVELFWPMYWLQTTVSPVVPCSLTALLLFGIFSSLEEYATIKSSAKVEKTRNNIMWWWIDLAQCRRQRAMSSPVRDEKCSVFIEEICANITLSAISVYERRFNHLKVKHKRLWVCFPWEALVAETTLNR